MSEKSRVSETTKNTQSKANETEKKIHGNLYRFSTVDILKINACIRVESIN